MNIYQLQPIQDFAHFKLGGYVSSDDVEHYKKGGKVLRQKQKQRQTQIVHIHNAPPSRRRRSTRRQATSRAASIQLLPQFSSVPSGYIHRPEPPQSQPQSQPQPQPQPQPFLPAILSRLDGIEQRMAQNLAHQLPLSLGDNTAEENVEAPVSSSKMEAASSSSGGSFSATDEGMNSQIPSILPDEPAQAAASADAHEEPGQAVETPLQAGYIDDNQKYWNTGMSYQTNQQSYSIILSSKGKIMLKSGPEGKLIYASTKGTKHLNAVRSIVVLNDLMFGL